MLQHVTLELRRDDGAAAEAFLRLLGFLPVEPAPGLAGTTAWFERGGTQIHLMWVDAPVVPRVGHAAVVVEQHDSVVEELRGQGYEVEPGVPRWGAARSFVRGPGGHRVELMAEPPPSGLGEPRPGRPG